MDGSRVKLDRMVSIVEAAGVQSILDVALGVILTPINGEVRPRFLSNSLALSGMSRRAAIFNSEADFTAPSTGYARDINAGLAALLGFMTSEELKAFERGFA